MSETDPSIAVYSIHHTKSMEYRTNERSVPIYIKNVLMKMRNENH